MNNRKEKPITPGQIKALHALFRKEGLDEENRHNFINHFTFGRVSSTKELTMTEAMAMIKHLDGETDKKNQAEAMQLCKSIYYLSLKISFLNEGYANATSPEDVEMNKAKISIFAKNRSNAKKPISQMSLAELRDFKKQLESIARRENETN